MFFSPRRVCSTLICALLAVAPASQAMLLDYTAYLGGTKVGKAKVEIAVRDSHYEITGRAETAGLLGFFSKWKSLFSLRGIFSSGKPVAQQYQVRENSRNREKYITYAGDRVHVTRNGEVRSPRPLPAAMDLYSMLFLSSGCATQSEVHDGKDVWQLRERRNQLLASGGRYCEFDLVDEDDQRSIAAVWLQEIGDLMVPVQISFQGDLQGTFKLTNHALD